MPGETPRGGALLRGGLAKAGVRASKRRVVDRVFSDLDELRLDDLCSWADFQRRDACVAA